MSQDTGATKGRSRENTRERLLDAAVDVFVHKGLKRVTVDDLVGAAGFTRGAFYSNFSSVDEVFFAVFRRNALAMLDRARTAIGSVPAGELDVDFIIGMLDELCAPDLTGLVLQTECTLLALRDDRAREILAEFKLAIRDEIVELIEDVLSRLGREGTLPTDQIAELVIAMQFHGATLRALQDHSLDGSSDNHWMSGAIMESLIQTFSKPV